MDHLGPEPLVCSAPVVEGLVRTRPYVVLQEFGDVREAQTFAALVSSVDRGVAALRELELFESVEACVGSGAAESAPPGVASARVVVRVKEKDRLSVRLGAATSGAHGDGDVSFEAAGSMRGLSGHGETTRVTYAHSRVPGRGSELNVRIRAPRVGGAPVACDLELEDALREAVWAPGTALYASRRQRVSAARFSAAARDNSESLRLELAQSSELGDTAAAPAIKAALKYSARLDQRDSQLAPTTGALLEGAVEVAGLAGFGDASFARVEALAQQHTRLLSFGPHHVALSLSARVGALMPLPKVLAAPFSELPAERKWHDISDRFFLGGPLSLRGFDRCGVGAREEPSVTRAPAAPSRAVAARTGGLFGVGGLFGGSQLGVGDQSCAEQPGLPLAGRAYGGSLTYSALALLSAPLPTKALAEGGFKAQLWANGGATFDPPSGSWTEVAAKARVAAGVGLVYAPAHFARVELNYAWILKSEACDQIKRLQFGIAGSFA